MKCLIYFIFFQRMYISIYRNNCFPFLVLHYVSFFIKKYYYLFFLINKNTTKPLQVYHILQNCLDYAQLHLVEEIETFGNRLRSTQCDDFPLFWQCCVTQGRIKENTKSVLEGQVQINSVHGELISISICTSVPSEG